MSSKVETIATVIGYQSGTGLYTGMTSHLMCEYHGKMFRVECRTNSERRNPSKIGSRIVISYSEVENGVPSNAIFQKLVKD